uniref:DNA-directed DNA polymerase n=1 Tax=Candidatus Kentrum sp. DK TaxID=2126562 RepID=A0A450RWK6_9GAMM|nr:MAG: DNA polymerase III, delta prime subunit [Candidatus Kentron sp. DK]
MPNSPDAPKSHSPQPPGRENHFPWQERQWRQCLRMQQTDRLPHAFLLRGPTGVGKAGFADRWANALVCTEAAPEARPCGRCRGCVLFRAGSHPDVMTLAPPPEKKTIGIDQIRALIDYVWLSRQFADRKVVIIPKAGEMTIAAANTLLKTLEEPPGQAVFLLVSDRAWQLPATVRSRCQALDFPIPPAKSVLDWLGARLPPEIDAPLLLKAAGGAPLLALTFWREGTLPERIRFGGELTDLLAGKIEPLATAARWKPLGAVRVLSWSLAYLADLIRLRTTMTPSPTETRAREKDGTGLFVLDPDHAEALGTIAGGIAPISAYRLWDRCLATRRMWDDSGSLNEALLLEGIAMDFAGLA